MSRETSIRLKELGKWQKKYGMAKVLRVPGIIDRRGQMEWTYKGEKWCRIRIQAPQAKIEEGYGEETIKPGDKRIEKLGEEPGRLGGEPGRLGVLAMVAAAVFVLWYFLLGGIKRG